MTGWYMNKTGWDPEVTGWPNSILVCNSANTTTSLFLLCKKLFSELLELSSLKPAQSRAYTTTGC